MANPPIENRRPGVDASIVQADWVRGYDAPAAATPPQVPCDLLISNGEDQTNGDVSNILIWNRTDDREQPMFILLPGDDSTTAPRFNVHAGDLATPDGIITAPIGSLYLSNSPGALFQNQDGATSWKKISDDLGGENLAETLAIGDFTGGNNIVITDGDQILGEEDNSGGDGGDVVVIGGAASGATGDGGAVFLTGGSSAGGTTGQLGFFTSAPAGTSSSGPIQMTTGGATGGGNSGDVTIATGNTGGPGLGGNAGDVILDPGSSNTTGLLGVGGNIVGNAGGAETSGQGGYIRFIAGSVVPTFVPFPVATAGAGGEVRILAGTSANAIKGGNVTIQSGGGGSLGGLGGDIFLNPGSGGGGADDGEIIGNGVLRSDNLKRGTGDPNIAALTGNEGDVYQRTDTGNGQLWLNVLGTPTGWQRLAAVGDFIQSFQQMQWGYIAPSAKNITVTDDDNYDAVGLFKGFQFNVIAGAGNIQVLDDGDGPFIALGANGVGGQVSLDTEAVAGANHFNLDQRFIAMWRVNNGSASNLDFSAFVGLTDNNAGNQIGAGNILPGLGNYLGFACSPSQSNWRISSRQNASGNTSGFDTGISTTATNSETHYFMIDASDSGNNVKFFIFDSNLNVVSQIIIAASANQVPLLGTDLAVMMSIDNASGAASERLNVYLAALATNADQAAQGAGANAALSLAQVLVNGNNTGSSFIEVAHLFGLIGEADGDGGNGAGYFVLSGATTSAALDTGDLVVGSASISVAASSGETGDVLVASGGQFDAAATGDTGAVTLGSGSHFGTAGTTGSLLIATGGFAGAGGVGATTGGISIAPGTFTANPSNPGLLDIRGGSTTLVGVAGGAINIQTGDSTGATGNTGPLTVSSPNVNQNGTAGTIAIFTGNGGAVSGDGGLMSLATGDGAAGNGGNFSLVTGDGGNGSGGTVTLIAGNSSSGNGPDVTITAGDTADVGADGGSVVVNPGIGGANNGEFLVNGDAHVTGKLTVDGSIDPDALGFKGVLANPLSINPGTIDGILYVDTNASPSTLVFVDDTGGTTTLGGGGATSLGSLTDVVLTAPANGEVLTYNGVDWVNLPGAGGSPLATILALGNVTGNTAGGIVVSTGDTIAGATDLVLDPGAGVGDQVVLDGLRWPTADGLAGQVLTTDGAGNLTFGPGGGGGGTSFAEAFSRMQWGSLQATTGGANFVNDGIFLAFAALSAGPASLDTAQGAVTVLPTAAAPASDAGVFVTGSQIRLDQLPLLAFHFDGSGPITNMRYFVGLTTAASIPLQVGVPVPAESYIGVHAVTDAPLLETTLHFVTDDATLTPTTVDTTIDFTASTGFWLILDGTTAGQVTLTLLDDTGAQVGTGTTIFAANLPTATLALNPMVAVDTISGAVQTVDFYNMTGVTRADLLNAIAGGGTQNLAQVLTQGNESGGTPIQGDDNAAGSGSDLDFIGGSSTGGGGAGGDVTFTGGTADAAGLGAGGGFTFLGTPGGTAGAGGDGGGFIAVLGAGNGTAGDGGGFQVASGGGNGTGSGGDFAVVLGANGATGGIPGEVQFATGTATGGSGSQGGDFEVVTGAGDGAGNGGGILCSTGAGGAGGGDGGNFEITLGSGGGGGADGILLVTGDAHVTGKLTVDGVIDPPGLLMSSSGAVPFTPVGFEGGIWVNPLGELIYTNSGGDLNISTAVGGGMGFLDALLEAGYGFMGPGTGGTPLESYGVLGSSTATATAGSGAILFAGAGGTHDPEGVLINLTTGAVAGSEVYVATSDARSRLDMAFKAVFKFQMNTPLVPPQTDQRVFIGFTDTPGTQINTVDDPAANEYIGLRQDLAGTTYEFVARGSGGAMVPVLAFPADTAVHYLSIDSSVSGQVTFTVYDADGITISNGGLATHTELTAGLLVPTVTTPLFSQAGLYTMTGTTPGDMDFYFHSIITKADVVNNVVGIGGGGGPTPTLTQVLVAGNTTGGMDIAVTPGDLVRGDAGNLTLAGGASGGAGAVGSITISDESGDTGGDVDIKGGNGGGAAGTGGGFIASGGTAAGTGLGGGVTLAAGDGAVGGGAGGTVAVSSGSGVAGNAAAGDIAFAAGNGAGTSPGGSVSLVAGDGGVGAGTGDGGRILMSAGSPLGAGDEGSILMLAGGASAAVPGEGAIQMLSSPVAAPGESAFVLIDRATTASGGAPITMTTGDAPAASGQGGGDITLQTGAGDGAGLDGDILLLGTGVVTAAPLGGAIQAIGRPEGAVSEGAALTVGGGSVTTGGAFTASGGDAQPASNLAGGGVTITSGRGDGTADGGLLAIVAGTGGSTSGNGGDVNVLAGNATVIGQSGGSMIVRAGGGLATSTGGASTFSGGDIGSAPSFGVLVSNGQGGQALLQGGSSDGTAPGGRVVVAGGFGGPSATASGNVLIQAGNGRAGSMTVGGDVDINGGTGGSGGAPGGAVNITAGSSGGGVNPGANVVITGGAGTGGAANGKINLAGEIDPDGGGYKFGTIVALAAATTPVIFPTPFAAGPPLVITVTIEGPPGVPPPTPHWIHSIGPGGFTVEFAVAPPAATFTIHWVARH